MTELTIIIGGGLAGSESRLAGRRTRAGCAGYRVRGKKWKNQT